MYLVNLAFDNQNFRQWTVRYKAIRHIFLSLREDPPYTGTLVPNRDRPVRNETGVLYNKSKRSKKIIMIFLFFSNDSISIFYGSKKMKYS